VAVGKPWLDRVWGDPGRLHIWKWKIDWEAKKAAMGK
jgi:oligopeptide transport system substrate-binding protein